MNGVKAKDYNDAVQKFSEKWFNGRGPGELSPEEAKKLLDKINNLSTSDPKKIGCKYRKQIAKYNQGVLTEIADANKKAAKAGKVVKMSASTANKLGKAAKVVGKLAKLVAPIIVAYALYQGGPLAAAETMVYLSPAGDAITIGQTVHTMASLPKAYANAYDALSKQTQLEADRQSTVLDMQLRSKASPTAGSLSPLGRALGETRR